LLLGAQVFEKIRGKHHVDGIVGERRYLVGLRQNKRHVGRETVAGIGVEIDGVFLCCRTVVDETAMAAGEIDDGEPVADQRLKEALAQHLPNAHLRASIALTEAEPIKLGEVRHVMGTRQAARNVMNSCSTKLMSTGSKPLNRSFR